MTFHALHTLHLFNLPASSILNSSFHSLQIPVSLEHTRLPHLCVTHSSCLLPIRKLLSLQVPAEMLDPPQKFSQSLMNELLIFFVVQQHSIDFLSHDSIHNILYFQYLKTCLSFPLAQSSKEGIMPSLKLNFKLAFNPFIHREYTGVQGKKIQIKHQLAQNRCVFAILN